jgi:rhamnosyltransferase
MRSAGRFGYPVAAMSDPLVSIVLRSFNEAWALGDTLAAIAAQDYAHTELIVIDSGSTDGSVELIRRAQPRHFVQIQPREYQPARVLNHGLTLARADAVVCINADATPQGPHWLRPLVNALRDPRVAASFGRQMPRPDCRAVFAHDYERCFGPARESAQWDHFFSMASSGLRKDVWARRGFNEAMQYSEDDEYTRWCRAQGYDIAYVPNSIAMHSHNYTPTQAARRSFGEGRALAAVWPGARGDFSFARTVALGWLSDARRDLAYCRRTRRLREWPHALHIRWRQRHARLAGFADGWTTFRARGMAAPAPPTWARLDDDRLPHRAALP